MRYRLLACLSALLLAGGGLIVATAQQAGAQTEFTVVATQTNFEIILANGTVTQNPTAPLQAGDRFTLRESLAQGSTVVGFDNVDCSVTFNNNTLCDAVWAFTGRGDIMGTALLRDEVDPNSNGPSVFDAAITGGTFAYAHASGSIHFVNQSNNVSQETFQF